MKEATRQELVRAISERYEAADRDAKGRILDEFVAITGYHRKHAVRLLGRDPASENQAAQASRARRYNQEVCNTLVVLWEASDRICGKRLQPMIPILLDAMERHGHLQVENSVRELLLQISAATIDRLLAPMHAGIRSRRRPSRALRRTVPVRTFADWGNPPPGFVEADLVAHCGESAAGSFVQTLVLTDICSGWTECVPLIVREQTLVVEALSRLQAWLPFPLRGFDTDNDSVFMNETIVGYCREHGIELTRSRAYHKNDQAWVEQKNGAVVRRLVGYRRLEGVAAVQALEHLYAASRLFVNFFQPSFKLAAKERNGARITKRYHPPAAPYQRLLGSDSVTLEVKSRLRGIFSMLDPLRLLDQIRMSQEAVAQIASGRIVASAPQDRDSQLDVFLRSLSSAWKAGEIRPTHRKASSGPRYWRTRKDPFAAVWTTVHGWLELEPERSARDLLRRLQAQEIGTFSQGQLRTLQRRVKAWRSELARQLICAGTDFAVLGVEATKQAFRTE